MHWASCIENDVHGVGLAAITSKVRVTEVEGLIGETNENADYKRT
jgi:hypothetical protein